MQFGLYLVRHGVISAEQLVEAIAQQQEERTPLGQLAIELGKLSARDVFRILRLQSDGAVFPFGQAARELRLLSEPEIAELLYHQSNRMRQLGEILVELGALTERQYEQELQFFRRNAERSGVSRMPALSR